MRRTRSSPLERMVAAIWVKSPFSHSALFGLVVTLALVVVVMSCPWG